MPDGAPPDQARIEAAVRAVLGGIAGALSATEAALLAELGELGSVVARAKQDVARLQAAEITGSQIPNATDELDAIVAHTAQATNDILDCCDVLEAVARRVGPEDAAALSAAITRIYEACSFQDITGQRISKVVNALKAIEARVEAAVANASGRAAPAPEPAAPRTQGQELANGPQLPGGATSQAEIDRLLASFD
jgi:chemotaxis protein CheZ